MVLATEEHLLHIVVLKVIIDNMYTMAKMTILIIVNDMMLLFQDILKRKNLPLMHKKMTIYYVLDVL